MDPPQFPAGAYEPEENYSAKRRDELIAVIAAAPANLRAAVAGLSEHQLDTRYRNWTIRQIVHHLADSHVNCYVRFKLALTEDRPTIKPYDESLWSALADSRTGDVAGPLALLDGLHACWTQVLRGLAYEQFARSFFHPETNKLVSLSSALSLYAWHGRHHSGQITWLRKEKGW